MNSWNVLLVDDDPTILKVQGGMVSRMGHVVATYDCPIDALDYLHIHKKEVDLVITDYRMPEMNGIEFIREVRALKDDMPIIILTGFAGEIDQDEAEELGVQVYSKPIRMDELAASLEQLKGA